MGKCDEAETKRRYLRKVAYCRSTAGAGYPVYRKSEMDERVVCRECGCSDLAACIITDRAGNAISMCSWIDPDLCSACGDKMDLPPGARVIRPKMAVGRVGGSR